METTKGKRLNSEKKLDHKKFTLKFGTTNKNNPIVVYLEGKTFISPNEENENYNKDIYALKYGLQNSVRDLVNQSKYFEGDYIIDFQIANSGIKVGKKSFLTFEILLKQPSKKVLKLSEVKENTEQDIYMILDDLEQNIIKHNFSVYKTKK